MVGVCRLSAHAGDAWMARTPCGLLCNSRFWCSDLHLPRRNVSASRLTRLRMRSLRAGGTGLEYGLGLHQRGRALADFLKCRFEATKLLRAQFREHSLHLQGVLSKGSSNEVFAARGEVDDPHAAVFGALDAADQALLHETVHGGTDRARGQIDDRAYRIDRQRPFVQ